jgi:syntaxin 1B/2/3
MTPTVLSQKDFLSRVENVSTQIKELTHNVSTISTLHQRSLASPSDTASQELTNVVTQTSILNTKIRDEIKHLEQDVARSDSNDKVKKSQITRLKKTFDSQLKGYQSEELAYRSKYREQIARQYRIVNPDASDAEVKEASEADWGSEGVFQTAVSF